MDDSRNVTQDSQQDVDQEVSTASALEEDTKRREDDGKNDLADIAVAGVSFLLCNEALAHQKRARASGAWQSGQSYLAVKGMMSELVLEGL